MSKYISKENLNHIVQEMGKKVNIIDDLTNEEIQEIIDEFNPEFVPEDEDTNVGGVPLAAILPWVDDVNTVPAGFLKCDGTAVSRTTYSDLFSAIGTKYGSGDGSTTFNVPDLTDAAILNGSYDKTSFTTAGSTTFTVPQSGWYKVMCVGGGGAGGNGGINSYGGLSGTQGGTSSFGAVCSAVGGHSGAGAGAFGEGGGGAAGEIAYNCVQLSAGDAISVTVGAGGVAPTSGFSSSSTGANGSGGAAGGTNLKGGEGAASVWGSGRDGTEYYNPVSGIYGSSHPRARGGSNGTRYGGGGAGSAGNYTSSVGIGSYGGDSEISESNGERGTVIIQTTVTYPKGGDGGDGAVIVEFIGSSAQYLIKYTPTVIDSEQSAATSASQAQAAAQAAESYAGSAGIPVGTLFPYAADTQTPPTGFLFCNGQAVSRTMYADLFSVLGTTYGAGDGSTTFNLPSEEFLKGMNFGTSGKLPVLFGSTWNYDTGAYSASTLKGTHAGIYWSSANTVGAGYDDTAIDYDSVSSIDRTKVKFTNSLAGGSLEPMYADMTDATPQYSSTVHYIIKAYDGVTPQSAGIDLSRYASDLSNKADRSLSNLNGTGEQKLTDTTESVVYEDGFAIIYPNGGSEDSPANITTNSVYIEQNPFDGYQIEAVAELQLTGTSNWCPAQFVNTYYSGGVGGCGVTVMQDNDGAIRIVTGSGFLLAPNGDPEKYGGIYQISMGGNVNTLPCRIKVWKVGKAANNA